MRKLKSLPENSSYIGDLPKGCKLCGPGQKMVLLITGRCSCRCFYCPLSFAKRGKKVIYANELKVENLNEIIAEAKAISAKGTGITGGDPMQVPELTLQAIDLLKKTFGKPHHIHLYTAGRFDPKLLTRLEGSGLDELRFHPPIATWKSFKPQFEDMLKFAVKTQMLIGLEIPVIPGYENTIIKLAKKLDKLDVNFLNLNELEFSESNWESLRAHGFTQKDEIANTVASSEKIALEILENLVGVPDLGLNVHYCSARFKDRQQLTNRIKRRAKNVIRPYHVLTEDGTFLLGIIESAQEGDQLDLLDVEKNLIESYSVPKRLMNLDSQKKRLEVAPWVLEKLRNELGDNLRTRCFIIEEYPTADRLEVSNNIQY
jgi:pyruvate formate-lyase activating enzyme-like uncharacterized protein